MPAVAARYSRRSPPHQFNCTSFHYIRVQTASAVHVAVTNLLMACREHGITDCSTNKHKGLIMALCCWPAYHHDPLVIISPVTKVRVGLLESPCPCVLLELPPVLLCCCCCCFFLSRRYEPLSFLQPSLVWWCIIMSQSVMRTNLGCYLQGQGHCEGLCDQIDCFL